jgi:hypothetical protein
VEVRSMFLYLQSKKEFSKSSLLLMIHILEAKTLITNLLNTAVRTSIRRRMLISEIIPEASEDLELNAKSQTSTILWNLNNNWDWFLRREWLLQLHNHKSQVWRNLYANVQLVNFPSWKGIKTCWYVQKIN